MNLAIADSATKPTGATATISGSAGGTVAVYAARVDGQIGSANWSQVGSRTGDGAISLALAKGYYFAYAAEGGDVSPLQYFVVTDGLDSVATRCRAAVRATIELLDLPCTRRIYEQWDALDDTNLLYPCVVLTTAGQSEQSGFYTASLDGIGRPILVLICDRQDIKDPRPLPDYESWRQRIERAFRSQRLSGVIECRWCTVEPGQIAEEYRQRFQCVVSTLTIRVDTREPRGLGA